MGITARLGASFAVVACLAIVANIVAEYGTAVVTTIRANRPLASPTPVAAPLRATPAPAAFVPTVHAEKAVGSPSAEQWRDLLAAAARFERATDDAMQAAGQGRPGEFNSASRQLEDSSAALAAASVDTADLTAAHALAARSRALRKNGEQLLASNDLRRSRIAAYWQKLDVLDRLLRDALDGNWKMFGHVFARQSLLTLIAQANQIRSEAVQITYPEDPGPAPYAAVQARESSFFKTLDEHQAELLRAQSPQWLQQVRAAYGQVTQGRADITLAAQQVAHDRTLFDRDTEALVQLARTRRDAIAHPTLPAAHLAAASRAPQATTHSVAQSVPQPQASPLPTANETVRSTTEPVRSVRLGVAAASAALVLLLLLVSIATVRSIVRPIRQFMATTRRLSSGDASARFERGGIAELDSLAVSLNGMAETLESAQAATREYQDALEVRIDERTRQLQHLALHDSLTGLPNRRQLHAHLTKALLAARGSGYRVAVFFIDLDNFKNINDSMGHTFGDRVLQGIAERLQDTTGPAGFAARLGGDEFMVVLSLRDDATDAARHGADLVTAFHRPLMVESRDLLVSVSVGGSVFPEHAESADALMRAADTALFSAKSLGRNQFSLFTPELLERAAIKFDIEQGLRRAVDRNEFELVFQPEVDPHAQRVVLAEGLLRWRLPDRRHMSPAHFLAVAREAGLNTRINDWVMRAAVEQVARWRASSWPEARVAINVSASQLIGPRFLDQMQELLAHHGVPSDCIEIELTEDILQTGSATIAVLRELRSAGLSIALDDFGTGFSTFSSLQQLPLTRVKLDQSLVACVDTDPRSAAIAGAIIRLCAQLGLTVTAEGIERVAQLDLLLEHGPICLQGYLISHPLAADMLPAAVVALPQQLAALTARVGGRRDVSHPVRRAPETDPLLLDLQAAGLA